MAGLAKPSLTEDMRAATKELHSVADKCAAALSHGGDGTRLMLALLYMATASST